MIFLNVKEQKNANFILKRKGNLTPEFNLLYYDQFVTF